MIRSFFGLSLLALLVLSAGCSETEGQPDTSEPLPATHWFALEIDGKSVQVQLAVSQREQSRGLMGRTDLGEDQGMIFVYPHPIRASFWMRNTPLPLDIGFFSPGGVLMEIYPMYPFDETSVRSRSEDIQFALEMNQGWFAQNQIRPGATLDLDILAEALRRRGFDPAEFRL